MSEAKKLVVAVDDGFAKTKVVCIDKDAQVAFAMSSYARSGVQGMTFLDTKNKDVHPCYETDGDRFTVAENLHDAETAPFDGYPVSSMNRAIINHALRIAAKQAPAVMERPLELVTGLPISSFYKKGEPDTKFISRKRDSLMKPVISLDGSAMPNIQGHKVFSEGLAAWIDYVIDSNLEFRADLAEQTIGIIDVGGRTTDIAVVMPGQRIDHARTGSTQVGAHNVMKAIDHELYAQFETTIPAHMLSEALTGKITIWGQVRDVSEVTNRAIHQVTERILRDINRKLGSAADLDRVLLVGGGAHLFGGLSKVFPNIVIPASPEFANARGFAKYAML